MKPLSILTTLLLVISSLFFWQSCVTPNPTVEGSCPAPTNIGLTGFEQLTNGNYNITYSWNPVQTAVSYKFTFYKNNEQLFSTTTEGTSQLVTNIPVSVYDTLKAEVAARCKNGASSEATSTETVYLNAITTDDIVYRADRDTKVNDICESKCDYILFTDASIKDSGGGVLNINTAIVSIAVYYDHPFMTNCLCQANIVTPATLNNCMINCPKSIITDPKFCN